MKKGLSILLALVLMLGLSSCGGGTAKTTQPPETPIVTATPAPETPSVPVAEEVKGVTIPVFSVTVTGAESPEDTMSTNSVIVTNETMAAYPVYSVHATSVNSAGTESTVTYVGFAIKDVLEAAGFTENSAWLQAKADDGYVVVLDGDIIYEDTTLLAVTKDGSPFTEAPWLAPCSDKTTGNYLKGMVGILINSAQEVGTNNPPVSGEVSGNEPQSGVTEILDRTDKVEFTPYSFLVNGVEVTNETLAGLRIFKITTVTENKNGELNESGYTGYKLADVLEACGVTGYTTVKAVANDGYETELNGAVIDSDYTLVAIEKDKELGEDGTIWLAPCSMPLAKDYCKLVVEIVAE